MRQFRLRKLVRDKIVEQMQSARQDVSFRILSDEEYIDALKDKLVEELSEFDPKGKNPLGELADLKEIIEHMAVALGADKEKLENAQQAKAEKAGAFTQKLYVETVTMTDEDEWASYYAAEPARFPEIKIEVKKE